MKRNRSNRGNEVADLVFIRRGMEKDQQPRYLVCYDLLIF